ncbi:MAG: phosphatase PAP2 family protein [Clostridia bacterium]|nr:phosphatase PAP2 family protein [Clostridia bacterium]
MKLTLKQKSWIAVAVFVVVFAGLLIAATFTDLEVSHLLTKHALKDGEYLADDVFGVFFEIVGSSAIYILIGVCATICLWFFAKVYNKKPWNIIIAVICAVAGAVAFFLMFSDIFGYIIEHVLKDTFIESGSPLSRYELIHKLEDNGAFIITEIILGLMVEGLVILALKGLKEDTLKKLVKFVLAAAVMTAVANLLVAVIKEPMGRMRYRAMNSIAGQAMGGFDNFTMWFVSTDNNEIFASKELFGYSDAFKSFPSGHTCAAGMIYSLIMLIDVLEMKKTWHKVLVWISTIVATGLVAVSRIVVGAHFFSDVLMGGTIAFLSMIIAREIFISKGEHVKVMFGSKKEDAPQDEEEMKEVCTCGEDGCECPFDCNENTTDKTIIDDAIQDNDVDVNTTDIVTETIE